MAVKKKTSRKAAPRKKSSVKKSFGSNLKRTSKKMIDQVLVKMSPQLQDKVDQLIKALENTKRGAVNDLSFMAGRILMRAQDVSRTLHAEKKKKARKK